MTDLDGVNLISSGSLIDLTYFMNWGFESRIAGQFFWSTKQRVSEFENEMPIRSDAIVKSLRLDILSNASTLDTLFALRKNGNNVITDETNDVFQFRPTAGQTGAFTTPNEFSYKKGDKICFKYREIEAAFTMIFRMQCFIEFEQI